MNKQKTNTRWSATRSPSPNSKMDPAPLDLDHFIPWKFMNLQSAQTVVVKREYQEDYPRGRNTRFSSCSRISRASTTVSIRQTESYPTLLPTFTSMSNVDNAVQLTVTYNRAGQAVEIIINSCAFPINCKLIEAISLSLPYHTRLNRLTCKGDLNSKVINEIAKALPFSNLTDICLDNTIVPEGNYYNVLDEEAPLKSLSLNKCRINDVVCKEIAKRLEFNGAASKNLRILCLSGNLITDVGAEALGQALRTNRSIMHLNLCGNSITSTGAGYLLEALSQFPLTTYEIREKIRRRRNFYEETTTNKSPRKTVANFSNEQDNEIKDQGSKISVNKELDENVVEDFSHPSNTVYKNGRWYSTGNLTLCSLNIGYNNLDYTILPKIVSVLMYEKDQDRGSKYTGLLRIVIEGNYLPINCEEYSKIEIHLAMLNDAAWSFRKKRKGSMSTKKRGDESITSGKSGGLL